MESRIRVFGHSLHQQLVPLPIGMLTAAVGLDLWYLATGNPQAAQAAWWLIGAGVVFGALAAIVGWLDWAGIPAATRAKALGLLHGGGNAVVLVLFIASWFLRRGDPLTPPMLASVLGVVAFLLTGVTAWMGGELVTRLGIGTYPEANPNAPSSLHHPS
jgi:uncharacterized membrane protein